MRHTDDFHLTFWEHLEELRLALIKGLLAVFFCFLLSLLFCQQILEWMTLPYTALDPSPRLVLFGPLEGLGCLIKISLWIGAVAASPFWLYTLFAFIAPALGKAGRKTSLLFLILSCLSMCLGGFCAYKFTIPWANDHFFRLNMGLGENLWSLTEYIDYTLLLFFTHALLFEACALLFLLIHWGIITHLFLVQYRRAAVVLIFILSAILTPPDVLSQFFLAIPLLIVYEIATAYSQINKHHK